MTLSVGVINVIIGCVYTSYGVMTIMDMRAHREELGFSHFGLAWILMAFTCGPHHLEHGAHMLVNGEGGGLDLAATLVGLPAGVTWFLLRIEAARGGSGDRVIPGGSIGVELVGPAMAIYSVLVAGALVRATGDYDVVNARLLPNAALVVLYMLTGAALLRTQLANHKADGNWSLSGLALTLVFPTCALMHGAWMYHSSIGTYAYDWHIQVIDTAAVPAAVYFLWVVWSLSVGNLRDWGSTGHTEVRPDEDPVLVGAGT